MQFSISIYGTLNALGLRKDYSAVGEYLPIICETLKTTGQTRVHTPHTHTHHTPLKLSK